MRSRGRCERKLRRGRNSAQPAADIAALPDPALLPVGGVDRAASHHTGAAFPAYIPARDTTEIFQGRPQTPVLASTLECPMRQSNVRSRMQLKYHVRREGRGVNSPRRGSVLRNRANTQGEALKRFD